MGEFAFAIGPLVFYWYGISVSLAILIAMFVMIWQAQQQKQGVVAVLELVIISIPVAMITARLYYVLFHWDYYSASLSEIFFIWHGGISDYGALLGVLLMMYFYSQHRKLDFWLWSDILALGLAIGGAIGPWGNLATQQAFGYPTQLSWGIYIDYAYRPIEYKAYDFFHPTFLYESVWSGLIFIILIFLSFSRRYHHYLRSGSMFLVFLLAYSVGRISMESFCFDSEMIGGFRFAQLESIIILCFSITLLVVRNWRKSTWH